MAFQTAAGATLAISNSIPATFNEAGYAALTYTEVGEITNIGEFGKEFALVTHLPLSRRGVAKRKGSFNNGTLNPTMALDPADAGQILFAAALESDAPSAFEITLQDGTIYYLMGLVMMYKPNVGTTDDVVTASATIEVDESPIVEVEA
jgi:hypothetical protein